ncbi:MAG: HAD family acid phosphatase, partial [Desulfovibrionaceae bacterium]
AWMIMDFMPAAPGMADMVEALQFSGVSVFVVSSRPENLRLPTLENLARAGYAPQDLFLVPAPDRDLAAGQFKDKIRTMLTRQGFTILATLDDHAEDVGEEDTGKVFVVTNLMY